jgi:sugar O-acyltransferase (sialic acid O-acetyltransferase NeuD family)
MRLLILGAGGHGRVVAEAAELMGRWQDISFLDDGYPAQKQSGVWPIIGTLADLACMRDRYDSCFAAFGRAQLRLSELSRARSISYECPTILHPAACVSRYASVDYGTFVAARAVINPFASIARGCIINTAASVDHDCMLGEGVHICPGSHLGGGVNIGARTWFGIGAVARQGICIGGDVMVAAGAVCVNDVRDGATVLGVPARERT